MTTPTESEIQDQAGKAIKIFDEMRNYAGVNADNFLADYESLKAALETNFSAQVEAALEGTRGALAGTLEGGAGLVFPFFLEYGKTILSDPDTSPASIFKHLRRYFDTNHLTVNSREFTFGGASLSGVGDGEINRLTKSRKGHDLEAQTPDSKTLRCTSDSNTGEEEGQEVFDLHGNAAELDRLKIIGSGATSTLTARTGRDSSTFIQNPSFADYSGTTGVPTDITGWVVTTNLSNFEIVTSSYYRTFAGEGTAASVKYKSNDTLTQTLTNPVFDEDVPIYVQVAYNSTVGSGDGTLTLTLGTSTVSVATTGAGGWKILKIALDEDSWYTDFKAIPMTMSIALSGNTTGYVLVDDVVVVEMDSFDGSWYTLVGGATPFQIEDEFTWTDSAVDAAIIQKFLWIYFGEYLPGNKAGTETWSDPT